MLGLFWGIAASAEKPKLAVADFRITGNVGLKGAGLFVAELLLGRFDAAKYQPVDRNALVRVLAAHGMKMAEFVSNPASAGGKNITGVRYVVVGSIVKLVDLEISARLVDVTTGGVGRKVAVSASATDARDLDAKLKRLAALLSAPEAAPPARPRPPAAKVDDRVDRAIARGLKFLFSVQANDGTWDTRYKKGYEGGMEALVLLTALTASRTWRQRLDAARLQAALKHLDALTPETVYVRAFRTMVYARLSAKGYAARMRADATWLVKNQGRSGGWGYGPKHVTTRLDPNRTDSSNTQLAVLALREAADRGTVLPKALWLGVGRFWTRSQNKDGGWGYAPPSSFGSRLKGSSHGSMAAAGVASLLSLSSAGWATVDDRKALGNGFAWLIKNYTVQGMPGWVWRPGDMWPYYYLWTLARACNRGGIRKLGTHDWYPELAAEILSHQRKDGSWSTASEGKRPTDAEERTCFALLALMQGRVPPRPAPKPPAPRPLPPAQTKWPFDAKEAGRRQKQAAQKLNAPVEITLRAGPGELMKLALIPAGQFAMGSRPGDRGAESNEAPQRLITISPGAPGFYMGVHEVTRGQFGAFVRATRYQTEAEKGGWAYGVTARGWARVRGLTWRRPGFQQTDSHPAVAVSWNDATAFCKWLGKTTGKRVALPTEAQWEYACRAGSQAAFQWGNDPDGGKGWCNAADRTAKSKFSTWPSVFTWSDGRVYTAPVGSYMKNAFGLHDMHGNVWEWCRDYYAPQYSTARGNTTDPTGPAAGSLRVVRGGSWGGGVRDYRSASRRGRTPVTRGDGDGFRIVVLDVGAG